MKTKTPSPNPAPFALCSLVAAWVLGCGASHSPTEASHATWSKGLTSCDPDFRGPVSLEPEKPLVLFVHGCNPSAGRFRSLAKVFEAHGQQTICFNYDDRDSLEKSSARLIDALDALETELSPSVISVLGHSQGGLVARRALIENRKDKLDTSQTAPIHLVTVSSPFKGILASENCAKTALHVLTFGVTVAVCKFIAGDKWTEIHPDSTFMRSPGSLLSDVSRHVKIVTDERDTCRVERPDGTCAEDDYVFSVPEQYNKPVDTDARVTNIEVKAGHVEIVGDEGAVPFKLIRVLQAESILAPTPEEQQEEIASLLARLYR